MTSIFRILLLQVLLWGGNDAWSLSPPQPAIHPDLASHQAKFLPARIEKAGERVYFAIGYDLANMIFVEGDDGVIVIDTLWWEEAAQRALNDFRKISDKPIAAIIYTHAHADHTGAASVFLNDSGKQIPIYAHKLWKTGPVEKASPQRANIMQRLTAQYGHLLPKGEAGLVGNGAGPYRHEDSHSTSFVPPTHILGDETDLEIAGVKLNIFYAPSDMIDGIGIWLPDDKALIAGDAVGGMAPYVTTPRFQMARIPENFIRSIDKMLEFSAEHLLPGHGPRVAGAEQAHKYLQDNRDLIQFLVDQTIRYVNKGLSPGEILEQIEIPEHLSNLPYLRDHYHRLSWQIRGIFMKAAGWFGGDPTEFIQPLPSEEARQMVALAGGKNKMLKKARRAYEEGKYGWAAQLASYLIRTYPKFEDAKKVKTYALRAAAFQSISANERNYLLTEALELEGKVDLLKVKGANLPAEVLEVTPMGHHFRHLGSKLDAKKSHDVMLTVDFHVTDLNEHHGVILRRGVSQHKPSGAIDADVQVALSRSTLLDLVTSRVAWDDALNNGTLQVSDSETFKKFLSYYEL